MKDNGSVAVGDGASVDCRVVRCVFDTLPCWSKGVESNDELRVAEEKTRHTLYNTWCVDPMLHVIGKRQRGHGLCTAGS